MSSESPLALHITIAAIFTALGLGIGYFANKHDGFDTQENVSIQLKALEADSKALPVSDTPVRGGQNALATIVIFTDFKAPACTFLYQNILDHAFKTHGDKIAVSYRAFPLEQYPDSILRAQAAAAAHRQNKFWEMANELFAMADKEFTRDAAMNLAKKIGLNMEAFEKDYNSREIREAIRKDIEYGQKLGVTGAPGVFINSKAVSFKSNITQDDFMSALNAEVTRMTKLTTQSGYNYYVASLTNQIASDIITSRDAEGRPAKGAVNPLVTIVEYSDYQCPFCYKAEPTMARILEEYPDTVRIVFSHRPLDMHKNAKLAAQAAHAAGLQGKFWEMHELLFKNQRSLFESDLIKHAESLNLNMKKFMTDLKAESTVQFVEKNMKEAASRNVRGTPYFLINGMGVRGAAPFERFKTVIDMALTRARDVQSKTGLSGDALYAEIMKSAPAPEPEQANDARTFVDISGAPSLGTENAPVTIVEFTDFECPFCSKANKTVHELMEKNPGKIRLVFKHNPLPFHKHAEDAHRAAEAAALQGKFWEMYDLLFENQKALSVSDIEKYAEKAGLNMDKFKADMAGNITRDRVVADFKQGASVNVQGTPHFFMNGTPISGALPLEAFQNYLDKELAIADKYIKQGIAPDALYKTIIAGEANKPAEKILRKKLPEAAKIALEQGKSYAKGPDNAPVTIYQFSEFECPFCSRVEPTIAEIEKIYGDKVRIVFKNFPLPFHKNAQLASEASLAAGEQGKYWEMHDILFKNQKHLTRPDLEVYAKDLGLDMAKFAEALDNHKFATQVELEHQEGQNAGITGTPSFVINGTLVRGAVPIEEFKTAIDKALAEK